MVFLKIKMLLFLFLLSTDVTHTYISSSRFISVNERLLNGRMKMKMDMDKMRKRVFERYDMNGINEIYSKALLENHRDTYGSRICWWGDFGAKDTRKLYHKLIRDNELVDIHSLSDLELYSVACDLVLKRVVAKIYSRERATIPVLIFSIIFDILRKNPKIDSETIWNKYLTEMGLVYDDACMKDVCIREVCEKVILKSRSTNKMIDFIATNGSIF